MTPALAFFYGGLVRSKNALNTMMMSVAALGFVGVAWAVLGYSLAFAEGSGFVGGLSRAFLSGVGLEPQGTIPHLLFMAYQGTFAIITAALVSGAIVERMRFGPYLAFITLWSLVVYAPVAHWVWGGGFLAKMGALDFAGGTVVHVNAATAALVAAVVIGQRKDYARQAILPHNVPFTLLGAGLLWFGWFGFNAGQRARRERPRRPRLREHDARPRGNARRLDAARPRRGTARPPRSGAATGIVVGLVAITPAAGFVGPMAGLVARHAGRLPELLRPRLPRAHAARRLARRGGRPRPRAARWARSSPASSPSKSWNGTADGLLHGNPGQLGDPGRGRPRDDRLQRRWRASCC